MGGGGSTFYLQSLHDTELSLFWLNCSTRCLQTAFQCTTFLLNWETFSGGGTLHCVAGAHSRLSDTKWHATLTPSSWHSFTPTCKGEPSSRQKEEKLGHFFWTETKKTNNCPQLNCRMQPQTQPIRAERRGLQGSGLKGRCKHIDHSTHDRAHVATVLTEAGCFSLINCPRHIYHTGDS